MKKRILTAVLAALLITTPAEAAATKYRSITGRYITKNVIVTDDGHIWEVSGSFERRPGSVKTIKFYTRYTNNVIDDIIVSIKNR